MGMQNWSDGIVVVDLPAEPDMRDDLKAVTEMVREKGNFDVVMDFADVDIITSSSLSSLLKLQKMLSDCGHRLVLCGVAAATKSVFEVTGIDEIFEFSNDKFMALAGLQLV